MESVGPDGQTDYERVIKLSNSLVDTPPATVST